MSRRTRDRLWVWAVVACIVLLGVGSRQVTRAMRRQQHASSCNAEKIVRWHRQLAGEVPADRQAEWLDNGTRLPALLLKACVVESRVCR